MEMGPLYRCVGDVKYKPPPVQPSSESNEYWSISLPDNCRRSSFIQRLQSLSPKHPGFSLTVISFGADSCITVGIAGSDIEDGVVPGHWNNTVGYHSDTGKCYTSHDASGNTDGQPFGVGDKISVVVSYFGKKCSEVIFYKNDIPVATRYLFQTHHSQFLPCIYMESGGIELDVEWIKSLEVNNWAEDQKWIRSSGVTFDKSDGAFCYRGQNQQAFIQSTETLGKDLLCYDVIVQECSPTSKGPTIAITTCSPLKPASPCSLLRDYLKWEPMVSLKVGDRLGWGVHHSPDLRKRTDFQPQSEQIVLCYVLKNNVIESFEMMVQPPGGFHPIVLLTETVPKISVKSLRVVASDLETELDKIYRDLLENIKDMLESDAVRKRLTLPMLRLTEVLKVDISSTNCHVSLPESSRGIHAIQFLHPLSKDSSYFYIEVNKLSACSWVSMGVAGASMSLSDSPGLNPSSVAVSSHKGILPENALSTAHMESRRFKAGDKVGVEISCYADNLAVVLFFKNDRPIGTHILREADRNKYLPTVALYSGKEEVSINIVWQTRVAQAPVLNPFDLTHWCLPHESDVSSEGVVNVPPHQTFTYIQSPISLQKGLNHFEVELIGNTPPPLIALSSASPSMGSITNKYHEEFIHFWPVGKASATVSKGDLIGWGIVLTDKINPVSKNDVVICYLTVNREVVHTQPVVLPPGGFYPLVVLPPGVDGVKFDFSACWIENVPITPSEVQAMVREVHIETKPAYGQIYSEKDIDLKISPRPIHPKHSNIHVKCDSEIEHYETLFTKDRPTEPPGKATSSKSMSNSKKHTKKKSKDKKKASLGRSTEIKFQSRELNYAEEYTDQYQSKTCSIL